MDLVGILEAGQGDVDDLLRHVPADTTMPSAVPKALHKDAGVLYCRITVAKNLQGPGAK